MNKFEH